MIITNKSGTAFKLTGGCTCNIIGIEEVSSGGGLPAIEAQDTVVNIIECGTITATDAPALKGTNAKFNVSNLDVLNANSGIAVLLKDSNAILSNVYNVNADTPVSMEGTCHVNINRITSLATTGGDKVSFVGANTQFGSLTIQNMNLVDGSIHTHNMNVTLVNVGGVGQGIVFGSDSAKGTYRLKIDGPTVLDGTKSLDLIQSTAELRGVTLNAISTITDSVVTLDNSYSEQKLTIVDSTVTGTRTTFREIAPTTSHLTMYNSTIDKLTSDASSMIAYHSLVSGDVSGINRSAAWLHNSKVSGSISMKTGSSLVGSAASLPGSATVNASFMGIYGGTYGTVTTSNKGLALAFGSASGTIDGRTSSSNVLSAKTDELDIYADMLKFESVQDTVMIIGHDWLVTTTGNTTLKTTGNYSNTVTGSYHDSIGTSVLIQTGTSFTVTASGAVVITGNPTVTI